MKNLIPENFNLSPDVQTNPAFLFADGLCMHEVDALAAASAASSHRLVKAPKSQTREEELELAHRKTLAIHKQRVAIHCAGEALPEKEWEPKRTCSAIDAEGCSTVIEFREWQETWRVRTQTECTAGIAPPDQSGARESEMLTSRGATKIAESCEFMHLKHGGFKTFVTGTFRDDVRQKIIDGETSIQKEVTRTMDALQKMYRRGWVKKDGTRIAGHGDGLPYLWVVEVPENEKGEPNPHIHMLLGWAVEYRDFKEWAERIENIWGNGYFHLEKIKDTASAGAYMAKAAGYLTKGGKEQVNEETGEINYSTQGRVEGNRYGISKTARAPAWVEIGRAQLHAMGQLIFDVYDHLTVKYGEKYQERKRLNKALERQPKDNRAVRKKIGEKLAKVRAELNEIPIRCNKYQVVVKGKAAAMSFFTWLKTPSSEGVRREEWLPEKIEGWEWQSGPRPQAKNSPYFRRVHEICRERRFWRRLEMPQWFRFENSEQRGEALNDYDEWARMEPCEMWA